MTYPAAAIRTAISELLEGSIGTTRVLLPGVFLRGVFEGQPEAAQKALALQKVSARHRFDVEFGALRDHPATPVSALSSYSINTLDITIRVFSALATSVQRDQREADIATFLSDCKSAVKALGYPHNLTTTDGAVATNIIGGSLVGPEGSGQPATEEARELWDRQVITVEIRCRAFIRVDNEAAILVLDSLTADAVGAWSVAERLTTAWTGSLIRVRRASDDTELDVGYVTATGALNTTALATFCSGTNGFIKTIYDQTGGGFHFTQSTAAAQPKIYDSATGLVTLDGVPAATFDAATDQGFVVAATGASCGLSGGTALTYYWHGRFEAFAASAAIMGLAPWTAPVTNGVMWFLLWGGGDAVEGSATNIVRLTARYTARDFNCTYEGVTSSFVARLGAGADIGTIELRQNGVALTQERVVYGVPSNHLLALNGDSRHLGVDSFGASSTHRFVRAAVFGSSISNGDVAYLEAA